MCSFFVLCFPHNQRWFLREQTIILYFICEMTESGLCLFSSLRLTLWCLWLTGIKMRTLHLWLVLILCFFLPLMHRFLFSVILQKCKGSIWPGRFPLASGLSVCFDVENFRVFPGFFWDKDGKGWRMCAVYAVCLRIFYIFWQMKVSIEV